MALDTLYSATLRPHRMFSPLSVNEFDQLLQHAKIVSLSKGEHLFTQGDPAHNFYFIVSGQVKLFRLLKDGSEKIIQIMNKDEPFAHAVMFKKQKTFPVCTQAIAATELISIRNQDYIDLIKTNSDIALELLGSMSANMNNLIQEIEILSLKSSTTKVVQYLQTLMADKSPLNSTFALPAAKHMIASMLAIQPETLSRIFYRLQKKGLIQVDGADITILSPEEFKLHS